MISCNLLKEHLSGGFLIANVLDIGCGFPRNLLHIMYSRDVSKVIGVDEKSIGYISDDCDFRSEIKKRACMKDELYSALTENHREDGKISFYLAHKLYMRFIEGSEDLLLNFEEFYKKMIFKDESPIEKLLEKPEEHFTVKFDLIIASKVLSWTKEEKFQNLYKGIKSLLKPTGYLLLRLNSDDFTINDEKDKSPGIKRVFTQNDFDEITSQMTNVKTNTLLQDGKRVFEIIGRIQSQENGS